MTDGECQDVSDIDPDFDARKVPFAMYYTSGTTDLPKCVVLSQFYFTFSASQRRCVYFICFIIVGLSNW